jgi:hypothetical protein
VVRTVTADLVEPQGLKPRSLLASTARLKSGPQSMRAAISTRVAHFRTLALLASRLLQSTRDSVSRHICHFTVCFSQVIRLAMMADVRAERTGARPSRAIEARWLRRLNLTFTVVRFLAGIKGQKDFFGNHGWRFLHYGAMAWRQFATESVSIHLRRVALGDHGGQGHFQGSAYTQVSFDGTIDKLVERVGLPAVARGVGDVGKRQTCSRRVIGFRI